MAQSGARRRKVYLIGVLGGLLALAAAFWLALPCLIEDRLISRLKSAGVPVSQLTVTSVGLNKFELANLRLGTNDQLTAKLLTARFTITDLLAGRVDDVEIDDLHASARFDSNGLTVNGLEGSGTPGRFFDADLQSWPRISIDRGHVELSTDVGLFTMPFSATLTPAAGNALTAAVQTRVESEVGQMTGRIDVAAAAGSISADIQIVDGTITIGGGLRTTLAGRLLAKLAGNDRPTLQGDLRLGPTRVAGLAFAGGSASIDGSAAQWTSHLTLTGDDHKSDLQGMLAVAMDDGSPHILLNAQLSASAASALWTSIGPGGPQQGRVSIGLNLAGQPPPDFWERISMRAPEGIPALLTAGNLDGSMDIKAGGLTIPSVGDLVSTTASFDLRAAEGALNLKPTSAPEAVVVASRTLIENLRLPDGVAAIFDGPIKVSATRPTPLRLVASDDGMTLSGRIDASFAASGGATATTTGSASLQFSPALEPVGFTIADGSLRIHDVEILGTTAKDIVCDVEIKGSPGRLDGRAKIRGILSPARLDQFSAQEAHLDLGADFQLDQGRLDVRMPADSLLMLRQLSSPYLASKIKELSVAILKSGGSLFSASLGQNGMTEFSYAVEIGPIHTKLPLLIGGTKPTRATLRWPDAILTGSWTSDVGYQGSIDLSHAAVALPDQQTALQGMKADIHNPPGTDTQTIEFEIEKILSSRKPATFLSMGFSGRAEFDGDRLALTGRLADPRKSIEVVTDLTHSLSTRKGQLILTMAPVRFAPDKLQPRDLLPALGSRIDRAEGSTAIAGALSWNKGKIRSDLRLLLQDVSLASPQASVVRLNSVIAIRSLMPLATERHQQVALGLLDIGVPLSDLLASFRIEPGPRLVIEEARLSLAGGKVEVEPIELDPDSPTIDTTLRVTDVDLDQLLELAAIEGLTATGHLAGEIPLVLRNSAVEIRDAVLNSTEPGILRYAPKQTPSALLGAGESVDLALRALSNFHYTELRLTLDRDAGGDTAALMHVKGSNPDFYGGYPVEFNLNVSGKLDQILDRSLSSYRIPDTIREQLQHFPR